jgi:hypothetical protein
MYMKFGMINSEAIPLRFVDWTKYGTHYLGGCHSCTKLICHQCKSDISPRAPHQPPPACSHPQVSHCSPQLQGKNRKTLLCIPIPNVVAQNTCIPLFSLHHAYHICSADQ